MARAGGILGLTAMLFLAGCTSAGRTNNQKSESSGGTWATGSWFAWETNETHDAYVLDFSLAAPFVDWAGGGLSVALSSSQREGEHRGESGGSDETSLHMSYLRTRSGNRVVG